MIYNGALCNEQQMSETQTSYYGIVSHVVAKCRTASRFVNLATIQHLNRDLYKSDLIVLIVWFSQEIRSSIFISDLKENTSFLCPRTTHFLSHFVSFLSNLFFLFLAIHISATCRLKITFNTIDKIE